MGEVQVRGGETVLRPARPEYRARHRGGLAAQAETREVMDGAVL